jgi:hypothetical protein
LGKDGFLNVVEGIIAASEEHLEMCQDFSNYFDQKNGFYDFYLFLVRICQTSLQAGAS